VFQQLRERGALGTAAEAPGYTCIANRFDRVASKRPFCFV
jgi:hypothetical protein